MIFLGMASIKSVCALLVHLVMVGAVIGNVVLMGENVSKSFDDMEANFTPRLKGSGESGVLYVAEPIDGCSPLVNKVVEGSKSPFALIMRGRCSFDDKVRSAQNSGFRAAIIYDSEDNAPLIEMGGTPDDTKIHAVFISKASGWELKEYAGHTDVETWILPTSENSPWSIMAVSFISLLVMSSVLATCFFVCKHTVRRERPRAPQVQQIHGMSRRLVKAMPSVRFTTVLEDKYCTSRTCAICLEDYNTGEKLRILPCSHKFHTICVDSWLTAWRTFCPVCKRDARTGISIPPASDCTPLLSSGASSLSSNATLLSRHSSLATSPSIPIASLSMPPSVPVNSIPLFTATSRVHSLSSTTPLFTATSRVHSLSSTHHLANSYRSHNNSPANSYRSHNNSHGMYRSHNNSPANSYRSHNNSHGIYLNGSFTDHRNISSQRSQASYLISPHSIDFPLRSSYSSRYMCSYNPNSSHASSSYLAASSGHYSYLRHSESGASISALASAQSLPSS